MPFPTTDWPGSIDTPQTRVDGVDIVWDDDYMYQDEQVIQIQTWLGVTNDLLGEGIAGAGIGGAISAVATGGTAFRLAARAAFATGTILSVGDNEDVSYVEKFSVDTTGVIKLRQQASLPSAGTLGRIGVQSGAPSGVYMDDGANWKGIGPTLTGSGSPDGSVTGFLGQRYFDTSGSQWYTCSSNPTGTIWVAVAGVAAPSTVQTATDAAEVIWSQAVGDTEAISVVATITGMETDGSNSSLYRRGVLARRPAAGSLGIRGTQKDMLTVEDQAVWNAYFVENGNTLELKVQGDTATTIDWVAVVETTLIT